MSNDLIEEIRRMIKQRLEHSMMEVLEIIDEEVAKASKQLVCKCTFAQRMNGDGCDVCNPSLAAEKWFIVNGRSRSPVIEEQDDIGTDGDYILFKCMCKEPCPDGIHRVHKVHIGSSYFRNRSEAEKRVEKLANGFRHVTPPVEAADYQKEIDDLQKEIDDLRKCGSKLLALAQHVNEKYLTTCEEDDLLEQADWMFNGTQKPAQGGGSNDEG